jgi:tetratricopeptide (TPR) repeat protein
MKRAVYIGVIICGLVNAASAQDWSNQQLGATYYQNKEYDKALPYIEKLYAKTPSKEIYHEYLDCLEQTKDYKGAEKLVKKQMKVDPDNLLLWIDLGQLNLMEGDEKQEKESFEKAIKKLTIDRNQILALGQAFVDLKEYDYALETYKKGKSLLKDSYPFLFETGAVYKAMGNIAEMADSYLDALLISPNLVQSVQDALEFDVGDNADEARNNTIRKEVLRYVQRYPENEIYSEMLIWMMVQQKDYDDAIVQVKALDRRKHEGGYRVLSLARTCVSNEAYDPAIQAYQYVIDIGGKGDYYSQAKTEQLSAMYKKLISGGTFTHEQLVDLQAKYKQTISELTEYSGTVLLMENLAHLDGFYLNDPDDAVALLNDAIAMPGLAPITQAHCNIELADVYVAAGKVWEASLLYSRVYEDFKHDPVGEDAKLKNAVIYFYTGNFKWAKAQLDILKAATSKLTANDAMALSLVIQDNTQDSANTLPLQLFAKASLFDFQNKEDSALRLLDSVYNMNSERTLKEQVLDMYATIAIKKGNYTDAAKYYEQEISTYPDGMIPDKALFNLAQMEEKKLHNTDKATDHYKQLILNYPGSFYVEQARDRYRHLSKTDAAPTAPIN